MSDDSPKRRSPRKQLRDTIGRFLLGSSLTDQAAVLRSFLLNALPEADRAPIEERILSDEAFYAVVVATEQELLDAYAHGELSTADAERVGRIYGSSPVRLKRARIAQALCHGWSRPAIPALKSRSALFSKIEETEGVAVAVRGEGITSEDHSKLQLIARRIADHAPEGFPLSPNDLLRETYVRMSTTGSLLVTDRTHLLALAARVMRKIIVEHARGQNARISEQEPAWASVIIGLENSASEAILLTDNALNRLEQEDPRKSNLIELRYFAGLTVEEIATALNLSVRTIKRDLQMATAWLKAAMTDRSS